MNIFAKFINDGKCHTCNADIQCGIEFNIGEELKITLCEDCSNAVSSLHYRVITTGHDHLYDVKEKDFTEFED